MNIKLRNICPAGDKFLMKVVIKVSIKPGVSRGPLFKRFI